MPVRPELVLRLPNSPGALVGVCALLSDAGTPPVALSLGPGGVLRLVVDNPVRALGTLREHHHKVEEHPVLVSSLGASAKGATEVLSSIAQAGINVEYAYTGRADGAQPSLLVMGVDDPARAATAAGV